MRLNRNEKRARRHRRIRKKLVGTKDRPRLCIHRSHLNLNAQLIDDFEERTLCSMSTLSPAFRRKVKERGNVKAAKKFGEMLGAQLKEKGYKRIAFDRSGYLYHGRIKAVAESLHEFGINF